MLPRRDLYVGKDYLPVSLLQYGRGCRFSCDFCAVSAFFHKIFQVPFQMPVKSYDIEGMLHDFLTEKIARANNIADPDIIFADQTIIIPQD